MDALLQKFTSAKGRLHGCVNSFPAARQGGSYFTLCHSFAAECSYRNPGKNSKKQLDSVSTRKRVRKINMGRSSLSVSSLFEKIYFALVSLLCCHRCIDYPFFSFGLMKFCVLRLSLHLPSGLRRRWGSGRSGIFRWWIWPLWT